MLTMTASLVVHTREPPAVLLLQHIRELNKASAARLEYTPAEDDFDESRTQESRRSTPISAEAYMLKLRSDDPPDDPSNSSTTLEELHSSRLAVNERVRQSPVGQLTFVCMLSYLMQAFCFCSLCVVDARFFGGWFSGSPSRGMHVAIFGISSLPLVYFRSISFFFVR